MSCFAQLSKPGARVTKSYVGKFEKGTWQVLSATYDCWE